MDHSNYYTNKYANYMLGPLNYQLPTYDNNQCAEYQPSIVDNELHSNLLQNPHSYDLTGDNVASKSSCKLVASGTNVNISHSQPSVASVSALKYAKYNAYDATTNKNYTISSSTLPSAAAAASTSTSTTATASSSAITTTDSTFGYSISYSNAYSTPTNKLYDQLTIASVEPMPTKSGAGVDVSMSQHTTNQANLSYPTYQKEIDYSGVAHHKNVNQYYNLPTNAVPSTHSTHTNVSTANVIKLSTRHPQTQYDAKVASKTNVIKPLNVYPSPINYKMMPSHYPSHVNSKLSIADAPVNSPINGSNSSSNRSSNTTTYPSKNSYCKPTEVICPEPIARYPAHGFPPMPPTNNNVATQHYYPPVTNYLTGYNQTAPSMSRQMYHPTRTNPLPANYHSMTPTEDGKTANVASYYNSQIVRPTPSNYTKSQLPQYGHAANYNSTRHSLPATQNVHMPIPKNGVADYDMSHHSTMATHATHDESYDRHYRANYNQMYNTNYIDMYDDFYLPKPMPKYNSYGMNMAQSSTVPSASQSNNLTINPSYDTSASATHQTHHQSTQQHHQTYPIVPNPIYSKELYSSQQMTQQFQSNYLAMPSCNYATNGMTAAEASTPNSNYLHHYGKPLAMGATEKYSYVDLEDKINSSTILKANRMTAQSAKDYLQHQTNYQQTYKASMAYPGSASMMLSKANMMQRKTTMSSANAKNQYVYNYNTYSNCYQEQRPGHLMPGMQKPYYAVPLPIRPGEQCLAGMSTDASKKQSVRDFLSSWNEDEEEEGDLGKNKSNFCNEAVNLQNSYIRRVTETVLEAQKKLTMPFVSDSSAAPKIHVGITVDNGGTHNLPDIIIDIEKPKVAGDGECFERTNAISEPPTTSKPSEKLYVLDAVDVPLADLSKYRHLSVVNKLPDNIVMPAEGETGVSESLKYIEEVESNHARFFKNDFEMNVEYDDDGNCTFETKDIVECRNVTAVQKVKKIIRKYRKQREYLRQSRLRNALKGKRKNDNRNSADNIHSCARQTTELPPPPPLVHDHLSTPVDLSVTSRMISPFRQSDVNEPDLPMIGSPTNSILNELVGSPGSLSSMDSILSLSNEDLNAMCIRKVSSHDFQDIFNEITSTAAAVREDECANAPIRLPEKSPTQSPVLDSSVEEMESDESKVKTLRQFAYDAMLISQMHLKRNVGRIQSAIPDDQNAPIGQVPTLQELARRVADMIYSCNVKSLREICQLNVEKYDHMFNAHRLQKNRTDADDEDISNKELCESPESPSTSSSSSSDSDSDDSSSSDEPMSPPTSRPASPSRTTASRVKSLKQLAQESIERQLECIEEHQIDRNSMLAEMYEIPTLRNLCETALPVLCLIAGENDIIDLTQSDDLNENEHIVLCLDDGIDEAELAQIVGQAPDQFGEISSEMGETESNTNESAEFRGFDADEIATEISKLAPQINAIVTEFEDAQQAEAAAPCFDPPSVKEVSQIEQVARIEEVASETENLVSNEIVPDELIHDIEETISVTEKDDVVVIPTVDDIQYEETVAPYDDDEGMMIQIEPFKKYLQKKYVQTPNLFKMFIVNCLLKKYIIYQQLVPLKRHRMQAKLKRITNRRTRAQRKRSKIISSNDNQRSKVSSKLEQRQGSKVFENSENLPKINKCVERNETNDNRIKMDDLKRDDNDDNQTMGEITSSTAITSTTIACDILEKIALKRNLKRRKLNDEICQADGNDNYDYDDDRDISDLLRSYINKDINDAEKRRPSNCSVSRSDDWAPKEPKVTKKNASTETEFNCGRLLRRRFSLDPFVHASKKSKMKFEDVLMGIDTMYNGQNANRKISVSSVTSSHSYVIPPQPKPKSKRKRRESESSTSSSSSTTSSSSSSSTSSTASTVSSDCKIFEMDPPKTKPRIIKPIIDMEDISRQALLCRAFSENIDRNIERSISEFKERAQMARIINSSPTVRLNRNHAIDEMARQYQYRVQRDCINSSSDYKAIKKTNKRRK